MTARWILFAGVGCMLAVLSGCGDDPVGPEIAGGAGVRVVLPAEAQDLPVTVELWDDDNRFVAAPTCPEFVKPASAAPADDLCGRWQVEIWDLTGSRVRYLPEVSWPGRAYVWDGTDDGGVAVANGYYATEQRCLDSQGVFDFRGNYYVAPPGEECRWRVWSKNLPAEADKSASEFGPFPTQIGGSTNVVVEGEVFVVSVFFDNTYTVRVRGPEGRFFEQAVALIHGEYVEVVVDAFAPPTSSKRRLSAAVTGKGTP